MITAALLALIALIGCTRPEAPKFGPSGSGAKSAIEDSPGWQPGDGIPGWEPYEYECPIGAGADVVTVTLPDVWMGTFSIGTDARYGTEQIAQVQVVTADCHDLSCVSTSGANSGSVQVFVSALDLAVEEAFNKAGFYGAPARPESVLTGSGRLPLGTFAADGTGEGSLDFAFCMSRVRPDELRGVTYVTYLDEALPHQYFANALVQYPFDYLFQAHGAWDSDIGGPPPDDINQHGMLYFGDIDYDNAWDWDAITDPEIRTAVYDTYTPASAP